MHAVLHRLLGERHHLAQFVSRWFAAGFTHHLLAQAAVRQKVDHVRSGAALSILSKYSFASTGPKPQLPVTIVVQP